MIAALELSPKAACHDVHKLLVIWHGGGSAQALRRQVVIEATPRPMPGRKNLEADVKSSMPISSFTVWCSGLRHMK